LVNEEPASEEVERLLHAGTTGRHTLLISVVNWGEIYYTTVRRGGESAAKSIASDIAQMPITLVPIDSASLDLVRPRFSKPPKNFPTPTASALRWPSYAALSLLQEIQNSKPWKRT
jgi:hypothetical protein